MRDVVIALLPAFCFSVYLYGLQALLVTGVAIAACMIIEWFIDRVMLRRKNTVSDLSAVVTGMLLAFNLPSNISLWLVALAALVAIGIGKMSFGGLGCNIFNPALVGRVFLLISFPAQMTVFPDSPTVDSVTGATPLKLIHMALVRDIPMNEALSQVSLSDLMIGFKTGSLGEVAGILLLLGGLYLLIRKVITWQIPVVTLGSIALFTLTMWLIDPTHYASPVFHIFSGGALLGAIFMATDYVTSPMSKKGMAIFGIGIGVITVLIRLWGAYPEGISFAILIMNATVPLLNKYIKPRRFGEIAKSK